MHGPIDKTSARGPERGVRARSPLRLLVLAAGALLWLLGPSLAAQETPAQAGSRAVAGTDDADSAASGDGASFRVIIHVDNPTVTMEAAKVSRMFRKKLRRWEGWDNRIRALPVDLGFKNPIRNAFTRSVHGTSVTAVKSFWQRMIFMGRDVPPEEKESEQQVLDYVRANPGAIGYVAAETTLPNGVKEIKITP